MATISAGILMHHRGEAGLVVVLVHPGGRFLAKPRSRRLVHRKGGMGAGEDRKAAARREFAEELGIAATGLLRPLGQVRQRGGKTVVAYALEGTLDAGAVRSNQIPFEWPPRSGRVISIPEIDRAKWFTISLARDKILASQRPFCGRLERL